jgi:Copper transport outer membrane protein, MctB
VIRHRSYAVPLTAVLLALATGIALGAGPLTDTGSDASPAAPRVVTHEQQPRYPDTFAASVAPRLYDHGLSRRPVALVTMPGAEPATVAALASQVRAAGGQVTGTYAVDPQLVDAEQKSLVDTLGVQLAEQLRHRIDQNTSTYPRIGRLLAVAVATRGSAEAPAGDDATAVRQSLAAAHLLRLPGGGPPTAPLVLVVLGTPVDQAIADGVLSGLASGARGVVAVASTDDATLAGLHTDSVTRHVTTVDGSETTAGRVAAVLGLIRAWTHQGGAFGASGSDGPVPLR